MRAEQQHIVLLLALVVVLVASTQPGLVQAHVHAASTSGTSGVRVLVDNSNASGAAEGSVLDANVGHALIGVTNMHHFWTNVVLLPPTGAVTLHPASVLAGGANLGGLYADWGVIPPDAQAVWQGTFDGARGATQVMFVTPSLQHGSIKAGLMNVITTVASMLGSVPAVQDVKTGIAAMNVMNNIPDLVAAAKALQAGDAWGFATHYYKLLSNHQQVVQLQAVLTLFGIEATTAALHRLTLVFTIADLAQMAADEALSIILNTYAGSVSFSTASVNLPGSVDPISTAIALRKQVDQRDQTIAALQTQVAAQNRHISAMSTALAVPTKTYTPTPVATGTAPPTAAPTTFTTLYVDATSQGGTYVNMRSGPGTTHGIVLHIQNGTPISAAVPSVLGDDGAMWYQVEYAGKTGYVLAALLSASPPQLTATPVAPSIDLSGTWYTGQSEELPVQLGPGALPGTFVGTRYSGCYNGFEPAQSPSQCSTSAAVSFRVYGSTIAYYAYGSSNVTCTLTGSSLYCVDTVTGESFTWVRQ